MKYVTTAYYDYAGEALIGHGEELAPLREQARKHIRKSYADGYIIYVANPEGGFSELERWI